MAVSRLFRSVWVMGVLLLSANAWAAVKCERLMVTGSPDAPPYLWRDPQDPKHLMGASADLIRQALKRLDIDVEFLYAGKRSQALEEVRSGRMDLLADAPLNTEQLEAFDFIHPAVVHNEIVVWARPATKLTFDSLQALYDHPGVISVKTRLTPEFEGVARERLHLEQVPGLTPALQKLASGGAEYMLAGRYAAMVMAHALGLQQDVQSLPVVVDRPGLHLALSFNSACNDPWLRGQLAKKMTESAASGLADEAIRRNLELWKSQLQQPVSTQ